MQRHVVLVGLSGGGKTTLGRLLANKWHVPFYDTDLMIRAAASEPIAALLQRDPVTFRALEEAMVNEALSSEVGIISTGGGAVLSPVSRQSLQSGPLVIWLRGPIEVLADRLSNGEYRVLVGSSDPPGQLKKLEEQRSALYETVAEYTLEVTTEAPEKTLERLEVVVKHIFDTPKVDEACTILKVSKPQSASTYSIVIGNDALRELPATLEREHTGARVWVMTDDTVDRLYRERLNLLIKSSGRTSEWWTMPPGEANKSLETASSGYTWLAKTKIERSDLIVAFGGGVVGDVVGFIASTYMRGIRYFQLPTTIVAQMDSAIGGKVGVDLKEGKNLVGMFSDPVGVLCHVPFLKTLDRRQICAGFAEVIKSGMIGDPTLISTLEHNDIDAILGSQQLMQTVIERAAQVKVAIVSRDAFEQGDRRMLNYGHTIGHAIERCAGYGVVLHGEAVAWGMSIAARISQVLGYCSDGFVSDQDMLLRRYGLLRQLPKLMVNDVLVATVLDKKRVAGQINWIMPRSIGDVVITIEVPDAIVHKVLVDIIG